MRSLVLRLYMEKRAISFRSFEHKTSCTSVTSASGFKPQKLQVSNGSDNLRDFPFPCVQLPMVQELHNVIRYLGCFYLLIQSFQWVALTLVLVTLWLQDGAVQAERARRNNRKAKLHAQEAVTLKNFLSQKLPCMSHWPG